MMDATPTGNAARDGSGVSEWQRLNRRSPPRQQLSRDWIRSDRRDAERPSLGRFVPKAAFSQPLLDHYVRVNEVRDQKEDEQTPAYAGASTQWPVLTLGVSTGSLRRFAGAREKLAALIEGLQIIKHWIAPSRFLPTDQTR